MKRRNGFSKFVAATNGITLSKAPQNVPGGLLGIVPDASSPALVKALSNSSSKTASPASTRPSNWQNRPPTSSQRKPPRREEQVAMKLPVKVHLENPFLGKNCLRWLRRLPGQLELTTGATKPPGAQQVDQGAGGEVNFLEGARILRTQKQQTRRQRLVGPRSHGLWRHPLVPRQPDHQLADRHHRGRAKHRDPQRNDLNDSRLAVKKNNEEHP